jgi:hypothetical protein
LWRVEIAAALVLITWPIVRALVLAWTGLLLFIPHSAAMAA